MTSPRLVCQFSCGAPSAVAAKMMLARHGQDREVVVVNAFLKEEHDDNRRFLADCEAWFGQPVVQLRNEKFGGSAEKVWLSQRYFKGPMGAPCSKHLKAKVLDAWARPDDEAVLGFTIEEQDRFEDFLERNRSGRVYLAPLIDAGLSKPDCKAIVERAGIDLPAMYRLGYGNANCIGCPKGGEGYWNKIRRDFPEIFERRAQVQETIGPGAYIFRDRKTGERYSLRELPPNKGRMSEEPPIACSFFCELVEQDIIDGDPKS